MARRVLVTGADGFIGSHLAERLVKDGFAVKAMVRYQPDGQTGWLRDVPSDILAEMEVVAGDVRDAAWVRSVVKGVDQIFHLAALIAIPYSYHAPESYMQVNVLGTLHVLEAAREFGVGHVLITSTSEVYGTAMHLPMSEAHPLQAQSPYAASKIAADKLGESFFRSYGLPVTMVRPFNTYGPRQSARAIIPGLMVQMQAGKREILLGDTRPLRDFVFVEDTVEGFIRLAKLAGEGLEVNIATGTAVSMGDLAHTLGKMVFPDGYFSLKNDPERMRPATSEVFNLCGDASRLEALTGWKPTLSLSQGLETMLAWFREKGNLYGYHSEGYHL